MTSTKAKRDAIDARARELIAEGTMYKWDVLANEFGITRERARSSFARVQRQEQPKMKQIKAQMLHDLRELTNFCSREQLTDFFRMLGLDSSPGGDMEITRERIMGHPVGQQALLLLQLPLGDSLDMIMGYRAAGETPGVDLARERMRMTKFKRVKVGQKFIAGNALCIKITPEPHIKPPANRTKCTKCGTPVKWMTNARETDGRVYFHVCPDSEVAPL